MVKGLIAVLDKETLNKVEAIWDEFSLEFGVHGVSGVPYPHFSFHVADDYDTRGLGQALNHLTTNNGELTVQTSGIGVFTGDEPVVYINVARSPELSELHAKIWRAMTPIATRAAAQYAPTRWIPHITLAQGDIPKEKIPDVVAMLQARDFYWDVQVVMLGVLESRASSPRIAYQLKG